ncbi:FtsL-like putative cell division protein [Salibacteraceae bacterium]|jgi:hypothetical protein|nr:FtsL-like putative cell division protein [Salibacteraceae bacterium]MDB4104921.1 FtsL-like putative cell division protein [Salibacteraceae bacterium]HAQ71402.1 hypothetical protein [Flavobacteriales bacterium]
MSQKENKNESKSNPIAALLSGRLLTQDAVIRHLPFLLFVAFIGLVYIANGYLAEASVRKINLTQQEIKELRSEQISMKSELNNTIIESELMKIIQERNMGLDESYDPPKKIILESSQLDQIN